MSSKPITVSVASGARAPDALYFIHGYDLDIKGARYFANVPFERRQYDARRWRCAAAGGVGHLTLRSRGSLVLADAGIHNSIYITL